MSSPRKLSRSGSVQPLRKDGTSKTSSTMTKKNAGSNEIKIGRDFNRVKVFVRVRPFSKDEKNKKADKLPFQIGSDDTQLCIQGDDKGGNEKNFIFDHVFQMNKTNKEVSDTLTQPLVQSAMNGFNGTLMAYGQTGAGKTYSLMGDDGITKTLIDRCFNQIHDDVKHNYKVTVSYLQIYQEKIFDLLSNINNAKNIDLTIRENPRTGVYVDNLTDYVVRSPAEVLQYIANGKKKLVFAETKMNRTSSRSHAVLQMVIERTMKEDSQDIKEEKEREKSSIMKEEGGDEELDLNAFGKDVIIRGKIHICDLAGSERIKRTGATGDRLSEAMYINSSLLELGNVIQALSVESKTHVPFRNSVLTRLLQESLGGNCKTSLIVCVSPSVRDLQETKCTLNFGSRAMKVTNTAYVNMEVDFKSLSDQLLKQLQAKEDEIHVIRQNFSQELEVQRKKVKDETEEAYKEIKEKLETQQQEHDKEINNLKDQLFLLENEAEIKSTEVQTMEESIYLLDDISKRDKDLMVEMLRTEKTLVEQISKKHDEEEVITSQKVFSSITNVYNRLKQKLSNLTQPKMSVHGAIELLVSIQTEICTEDSKDDKEISDDLVKQLKEDMDNSQNDLTQGDPNKLLDGLVLKEDFHAIMLKVFLSNRIAQIKSELFKLSLSQDEITKTEYRIAVVGNNVHNEVESTNGAKLMKVSNENWKIEKKSTSSQTSFETTETGCQTTRPITTDVLPASISNPCQPRILAFDHEIQNNDTNQDELTDYNTESRLTLKNANQVNFHREKMEENQEHMNKVAEKLRMDIKMLDKLNPSNQLTKKPELIGKCADQNPKTEKTKEQSSLTEKLSPEPHLKRSTEIFSGFNSTLNRIEDMVKTERKPRPSYSSSISRSDDSYRSSSSLGFRADDSYRSGSSLGGYRFDETLTSKKYSSPYTTSFSSSSRNNNSADGFESKYATRSYASPLFSSSKYDLSRAYGGSNSARETSIFSPRDAPTKSKGDVIGDISREKDEKIRDLAAKIQELEHLLKTVKKENEEYVQIVEELSNVTASNDQAQNIIKRKLSFPGFQISEKSLIARKDNIQIAHIRPFSSEESFACDSSRNGLNTRDERGIRKSSLNLPSNNLIEFSPDLEKRQSPLASTASTTSLLSETMRTNTRAANYSSQIFDELNDNQTHLDKSTTHRRTSNRIQLEEYPLDMSSNLEPDVVFGKSTLSLSSLPIS